MNSLVYEDYKYFMQDVSFFYVGCKFTLGEITENDEIIYKFRKLVAESILPKFSKDDTLESILYYLNPSDFILQIFKQMNAEVRVSIKKKKKNLFGKESEKYHTEFMKITKLVSMSEEEKKECGLLIQELKGSKLALLTV